MAKILCLCCNQYLSSRREAQHREQNISRLQATLVQDPPAPRRRWGLNIELPLDSDDNDSIPSVPDMVLSPDPRELALGSPEDVELNNFAGDSTNIFSGNGDDAEGSEDSDEDYSDPDINWDLEIDWDESDVDAGYIRWRSTGQNGLSQADDEEAARMRQHLRYETNLEGLRESEHLSEEDKALLRAFAFYVKNHLSEDAYESIPACFFPNAAPGECPIPSLKVTRARIRKLCGTEPIIFDCCPKSCICYSGPESNLTSCPECKAERYSPSGKARKHFVYLPIIPRLLNLYRNKKVAREMLYRSEYQHVAGQYSDVYDGSIYRGLLEKNVVANGQELEHKYFCDARDVALGLSTDGFAVFGNKKSTSWPLLLFNYNLPSDTRIHHENILPLGVIPGPKKPKRFGTFLWGFLMEMIRLAKGVEAYDAHMKVIFALHAYLMLVFGDIPALSMLLHMKGHNGYCPCRMCEITALPAVTANNVSLGKTLYVPHFRQTHPKVVAGDAFPAYFDPAALPMRTHERFMAQATEVQTAPLVTTADKLSREYGIKGVPALSVLGSLSFPNSFPYDFMHLIWENTIKNLVLLWTGKFKGLDTGNEDYQIDKAVWEALGCSTSQAGATIPSAFGSRVPNIEQDKSFVTAEMWGFWTIYLGPVLLRSSFSDVRYYSHFIKLVRLLVICLKFTITDDEVTEIRQGFIQWVTEYEKIYYQHKSERLSACPVTIHALLHIADHIRDVGPVWCYWAFPMERFCGRLLPTIKSRRYPYASMDTYIINDAMLSQIMVLYGMKQELSLKRPPPVWKTSFRHPAYPSVILLPPHRVGESNGVDTGILNKIHASLATRAEMSITDVRKLLRNGKAVIEQWGKVKRVDSEAGDTITAASLRMADALDSRDATFVKYEMIVDLNASRPRARERWVMQSFYGQLKHIFVVSLASPTIGKRLKFDGPGHDVAILAVIQTCTLLDKDPLLKDLDINFYRNMGGLDVIDIECVRCLVGRVPSGRQWAIIDRSGDHCRLQVLNE